MLLLVFLVGLVTGFFDATIGAGGLIAVPSLIFLGLPPQVAIATDRFGTFGGSLTATYKFWKAKKIVWKYVLVLASLSLIGSVIGANILIKTNPAILQKVIGILLLVLLAILLLKRDLGINRKNKRRPQQIIGLVCYFFIAIFGGFFGQGSGPLIIFVLSSFLGLTVIEVLATNEIPWSVLSIASVIIFGLHHIIYYKTGTVLLVGMAIGGYIGANTALRKGDIWVKRLFATFVVVASFKLLF